MLGKTYWRGGGIKRRNFSGGKFLFFMSLLCIQHPFFPFPFASHLVPAKYVLFYILYLRLLKI